MVRMAGLEPARLAPLPPQDSVSTSSTTSARSLIRHLARLFTETALGSYGYTKAGNTLPRRDKAYHFISRVRARQLPKLLWATRRGWCGCWFGCGARRCRHGRGWSRLLLRWRFALACTAIYNAMRLTVAAGEHGKQQAGRKKSGCKERRHLTQKGGGAPRSEYGGRSAAAKGSTGIRSLAMLDQHESYERGGNYKMGNQNSGIHKSRVPDIEWATPIGLRCSLTEGHRRDRWQENLPPEATPRR